MGDMGEIFGCIRENNKARKAQRLEDFLESGLGEVMKKHTLYHWSTTLQDHRLEYWPTTCKWRWMDRNYWGDLQAFANFLHKRGWNGDND
jgi:hypothetical protein